MNDHKLESCPKDTGPSVLQGLGRPEGVVGAPPGQGHRMGYGTGCGETREGPCWERRGVWVSEAACALCRVQTGHGALRPFSGAPRGPPRALGGHGASEGALSRHGRPHEGSGGSDGTGPSPLTLRAAAPPQTCGPCLLLRGPLRPFVAMASWSLNSEAPHPHPVPAKVETDPLEGLAAGWFGGTHGRAHRGPRILSICGRGRGLRASPQGARPGLADHRGLAAGPRGFQPQDAPPP